MQAKVLVLSPGPFHEPLLVSLVHKWGVSQTKGYLQADYRVIQGLGFSPQKKNLGATHDQEYNVIGSILGFPFFGKLPNLT